MNSCYQFATSQPTQEGVDSVVAFATTTVSCLCAEGHCVQVNTVAAEAKLRLIPLLVSETFSLLPTRRKLNYQLDYSIDIIL